MSEIEQLGSYAIALTSTSMVGATMYATLCSGCYCLVPLERWDAHLEAQHPEPVVEEEAPSPWVGTDEDRHGPWLKDEERYEDGCKFDVPHEEPWTTRREGEDG